MKHKRLLLVILLVHILPILSGCGEDLAVNTGSFGSSLRIENGIIIDDITIHVALATDDFLEEFDSYVDLIEFNEPDFQKIAFVANHALENFRWIEINYEIENEHYIFHEESILFSMETLDANEPFVVTWLEEGTIPHRGISFVDDNSVRRYFTLHMNHSDEGGDTGTYVLIEFEGN
ncbi:MAG: hypothetical protein FWE25_04695 [Lachnospiraceae bacterium]|nr:hypothetical protein [Lachnospiraceae bacterium]